MYHDKLYKNILHSFDHAVCILQVLFNDGVPCDACFIEINSSFSRLTGLTDVTGKTFSEVFDSLLPFRPEVFFNVALSGKSIRYQTCEPAFNNRLFDIYAGVAEGTGNGHVALIFSDISVQAATAIQGSSISSTPDNKLKHLEEQRKETFNNLMSRKRLMNAAERIGLMGSWEKNMQTGELIWSDELYRIYGLEPQSVKVTSDFYVNKFVHPDDRKKVFTHINAIYETHCEDPAEYRILTQAGGKILLSIPRVTLDEHGKPVYFRGIVTDITTRKKGEEVMMKLKLHRQKEILNAVILSQEEERERIGEALHNGVAQLLYAVQTRLQLLDATEHERKTQVNSILTIVKNAIDDTRNISFELVPAVLKDYGLEVALKSLFQRVISNQLYLKLTFENLPERLPEKLEYALYRITQELVNNIVKHAQASTAAVQFLVKEKTICLKVADNGIGFQKKENGFENKGIGLQSVRNRLKLLDGKIKTASSSKGTTINIAIPLNL